MAELVAKLQEVQQREPGVHLLCPKQGNNDTNHYEVSEKVPEGPEDGNIERSERIRAAKLRREKFMASLQLLAYDGKESEKYKQYIWDQLDEALSSCDLCIREYYVAKIGLLTDLREEYGEEDIREFFGLIERRDLARITSGLDAATKALRSLPENKRIMSAIEPAHLHAIFESLISEPFLWNEELLRNHFDEPFRLIQSKKPLRIREYLPAVTEFLFGKNERRFDWANQMFDHLNRPPTELEWKWAIKHILQRQLQEASNPNAISRLWSGLRQVVQKLDEKQITHNLFDLVPNVCTTALNHLPRRTSALPHITATMKIILDKSPEAFWQAMGSISSSIFSEQVFASPNFNQTLQEESGKEIPAEENVVLSWIPSLLLSLKPSNRPAACQTLTMHLFELMQNDSITASAMRSCYEMAVNALLQTVLSFSSSDSTRLSVDRVVLSNALNIVSHRIDILLNPPTIDSFDNCSGKIRSNVLSIVRNSLALECLSLKTDFEALTTVTDKRREASSYSPDIWNAVVQNLHEKDVMLSKAALLGVMALPGLEPLRAKAPEQLAKEKQIFNNVFAGIMGMEARILERLADFNTNHLEELFKSQDTSMSLVAALFSADSVTYQGGIDLVKNLTGQSGRREALSYLLEAFLGTTIYGLCWVLRRISNLQTFGSVPRMLVAGMDVLDILCNKEDGILRTRNLSHRDAQALQSYWSYQWVALKTAFQHMERWSVEIHDKERMTEVCRNTMQYAEALFEQYDLFASTLVSARPSHIDNIPRSLLDSSDSNNGSPLKALDAMSRWLRLRDEYLADTIVKLLAKILDRLQSGRVLTETEGLRYVQDVATKSTIRTILSDSQKAVLVRALESYYGKRITREIPKSKKQSTLTSWTEISTPDSSGARTPISQVATDDEFGDPGITDKELIEISSRPSLADRRKVPFEKALESGKALPSKLVPKKSIITTDRAAIAVAKKAQESKAFIEERKREIAAAQLRRKEHVAQIRGKLGIGQQTVGQGSGLSALGVKGKEHASGQSSLMVSSSSESDFDDEEDERLFGSKVKTALPSERPTTQALGIIPTKKQKIQRSQKDIRARLAPDLAPLHTTILGWDFFADTDVPPNSDKADYTLVSNTFKTVAEYQRTFEPLLILEGWQAFRAAREDGNFKAFEIKIANSLIVDSFVEINSVMPVPKRKEDRPAVNVADIVLLSKVQDPEVHPSEAHCLARVKEVSLKKNELQIVYRIVAANNPMRLFLRDTSIIFGVVLFSLTPLEREYGALKALPYYDLCEEVINAKPSPLLAYSDDNLQQITKTYDLNLAQAKAVKSALDNDAFTLIQGPPGSGKTKTICAIVGAMMTGFLTPGLSKSSTTDTPRLPSSKKILVCAPSNAAVDELVMRFKEGLQLMSGTTEKLSVVRLGRSDAINANVKDVTLEELVTAKLSLAGPKEKEDINSVFQEHKVTCDELNTVRERLNEKRAKGHPIKPEEQNILDGLNRKKSALGSKIDEMRERQNTAARDADLQRKKIQQQILDSAHVLCATLSGSGHEIFQSLNVEFETVIIDEAAQSIELSALIPLKYGCSKCILVGDPKQLPPTVLSREAAKFQYEQSLFARMEKNHPKDVHLLDIQYRMHPEISLYPSKAFYDGRLKDGPEMALLRKRPWHHSGIFGPYRFFDVEGISSTASTGHSLINHAEVNVAILLYDRLITDVKMYAFENKIGVITPYKGQLKLLKERFSKRYGKEILSTIEFNTTDAFQGRESEIIIFSCVRASTRGIGFLQDVRRMNVGLTRAKCSLWVLGNSKSLVQGEFWRGLVHDAKSRNLYTDGDILRLLERPLLTEDMMKDDIEMLDAETQSPISSRAITAPRTLSAGASRGSSSTGSRPPSAVVADSLTENHDLDLSKSSGSVNNNPPLQVKESIRTTTEEKLEAPQSRGELKANPEIDRPSGGRFGLNDKAVCNICGSNSHFSHNCDDLRAQAASLGICDRCKSPGHNRMTCTAPRCFACGEVGHVSDDCQRPKEQRLSSKETDEVKKQEIAWSKQKERAREKRAEKQLTEYGAKIPEVKGTIPVDTPAYGDGKRKRENVMSVDGPQTTKSIKLSLEDVTNGSGTSSNDKPVEPSASRSNGPVRPPGRLAQPPVKKKRPTDDIMFMKRK